MKRMSSLRKYIDIGANLTDDMYQGMYHGSKKHEPDLNKVMDRAWDNGMDKMIITGGSLVDSKKAIDLARTDCESPLYYRRGDPLWGCTVQAVESANSASSKIGGPIETSKGIIPNFDDKTETFGGSQALDSTSTRSTRAGSAGLPDVIQEHPLHVLYLAWQGAGNRVEHKPKPWRKKPRQQGKGQSGFGSGRGFLFTGAGRGMAKSKVPQPSAANPSTSVYMQKLSWKPEERCRVATAGCLNESVAYENEAKRQRLDMSCTRGPNQASYQNKHTLEKPLPDGSHTHTFKNKKERRKALRRAKAEASAAAAMGPLPIQGHDLGRQIAHAGKRIASSSEVTQLPASKHLSKDMVPKTVQSPKTKTDRAITEQISAKGPQKTGGSAIDQKSTKGPSSTGRPATEQISAKGPEKTNGAAVVEKSTKGPEKTGGTATEQISAKGPEKTGGAAIVEKPAKGPEKTVRAGIVEKSAKAPEKAGAAATDQKSAKGPSSTEKAAMVPKSDKGPLRAGETAMVQKSAKDSTKKIDGVVSEEGFLDVIVSPTCEATRHQQPDAILSISPRESSADEDKLQGPELDWSLVKNGKKSKPNKKQRQRARRRLAKAEGSAAGTLAEVGIWKRDGLGFDVSELSDDNSLASAKKAKKTLKIKKLSKRPEKRIRDAAKSAAEAGVFVCTQETAGRGVGTGSGITQPLVNNISFKQNYSAKIKKSAKRLRKRDRSAANEGLDKTNSEQAKRQQPDVSDVGSTSIADVDQNELKVTIATTTSENLTIYTVDEVLREITARIIKEAKVQAPGVSGPVFLHKPTFVKGILQLWCADQKTVDWVERVIPTITTKSGETLVVQSIMPKMVRCCILIPEADDWENADDIMHALAYQNPWADCDDWDLHSAMKHKKWWFINISIPKNLVQAVLEHERRFACGAGSVYLKFRGTGGKFYESPLDQVAGLSGTKASSSSEVTAVNDALPQKDSTFHLRNNEVRANTTKLKSTTTRPGRLFAKLQRKESSSNDGAPFLLGSAGSSSIHSETVSESGGALL